MAFEFYYSHLCQNNLPLMTDESFGNLLRKLRKEANFSQEQLAEKSNLDRTYISLLERGLRQPTLNSLFSISNALGIKPHVIVEELENQNEIS